MKKQAHHPLKWVIWSLSVAFFFYEFLVRVFPSIIVSELISTFHISASAVGALSGFYFYAYAPMQLPVGFLMDRYGARKLLTIGCLICAIGTFIFSGTTVLSMAYFARLLIGFGSAFGFVGMVYISSHWFPGNKLALLIGMGNSLGMLGAVFGQGPLSLLIKSMKWRPALFSLGALGALLAFAIFLIMRNDPSNVKKRSKSRKKIKILENFTQVWGNTQSWLNTIISLSLYLSTSAFAALWAVPFLQTAHNLPVTTAGFAASMTFMGWIVGGPIVGYLSDRLQMRKIFLLTGSPIAFFTLLPIIYLANLPTPFLFLLLFILGIGSSVQILTFTLAIEVNNAKSKGTAIALINCLTSVFAAIFQPLVGYFLDMNAGTGHAVYSIASFQVALTCFPISCLVAFFFSLFIKEQKHKSHTIGPYV